jgi:hypothetical protein
MKNPNSPDQSSYATLRGRTVRPLLSIRGAERQVRLAASEPLRFAWSGLLTSRR